MASKDDVVAGLKHMGTQGVPNEIIHSLTNYYLHGDEPSGFVRLALRNKFVDAILHADLATLRYLHPIASFLNNSVPARSWGTICKVDEWCESGGYDGARDRKYEVEYVLIVKGHSTLDAKSEEEARSLMDTELCHFSFDLPYDGDVDESDPQVTQITEVTS